VRTLLHVLSCCPNPVHTLLFLRRAMGPGRVCPCVSRRSRCPARAPRAHCLSLRRSRPRSLCSRRTTAWAAPASVYLNNMVAFPRVTNLLGLRVMSPPPCICAGPRRLLLYGQRLKCQLRVLALALPRCCRPDWCLHRASCCCCSLLRCVQGPTFVAGRDYPEVIWGDSDRLRLPA
jgi:hypothetical protein